MTSFKGQHGLTNEQRFVAKIQITETCHIWTGGKDKDGYGVFHTPNGQIRAHRYSLARHLGRPIVKGYSACHTCDNPPCVNPKHLFEGTARDNAVDMTSKGRTQGFVLLKGPEHTQAKLTSEQITEIQSTHFSVPNSILAKKFDVHCGTISKYRENLGNRRREAVLEAAKIHKTQKKIAEASGVTQGTVSRILQRQKHVTS